MEGNQNINIQHPEVWELLVLLDDRRVSYILYTPTVANSLITGEVALTDDSLQGLEDAVYNTPVLLGEYRRVRVVVRSSHFLLLPPATSDEDCKALLGTAYIGDDGETTVCATACGIKVAYIMPRGMQAFLGRTFNYPLVYHHLHPLCDYFQSLNRGDDIARMFLNMRDGMMDMAIYRGGEIQCANSYPFASTQDAAYFALNAWRSHGLDQLTDELQLMGDGALRSAMSEELRKYVKYVMPAAYPAAAMQLGHNAVQAPLELVLLALCE